MFIVERTPGVFNIYLESGLFCTYLQKTDKHGIYLTQADHELRDILKSLGNLQADDDIEFIEITDKVVEDGENPSILDALHDPELYDAFDLFDDESHERDEEPKKSKANEKSKQSNKKKVEL